jgi:bifunctional non-homologous end joining protein LigD
LDWVHEIKWDGYRVQAHLAADRVLRFYVFDLLAIDGEDLRPLPLLERKRRLKTLLAVAPPALTFVEHLTSDGTRILERACRMGIEGIVSKRAASPYRSGRSAHWVKTTCERSDTFVVVGFDIEKPECVSARPADCGI